MRRRPSRTWLASIAGAIAGATLVAAIVGAAAAACDGTSDPPSAALDGGDATTSDGSFDAQTGDGDASDGSNGFTAASHLPLPTITYGGGPIVRPLRLVVVTFPGDPMASDVNGYASSIPSSDWWRAANDGVCTDGGCVSAAVGPDGGTDVRTIVLPGDAGATYDQAGVAALLHDAIAAGTLPAPDANTVYVVSFPLATTLTTLPSGTGTPAGTSCSTFFYYHRQLYIGDLGLEAGVPARVPFIALPRCSRQTQDISLPLARALVATAQDPTGSAFVLRSPTGWVSYYGTEAPDLCAQQGMYSGDDGTVLPRIWSNEAASKGDPCVPSLGQTYFGMVPQDAGDLYMPFEKTLTLPVTIFSDEPTEPLALEVTDIDEILAGMPTLTATIDRKTAVNGDTANVSVHFNAPPGERSFAVLVLFAVRGSTVHAWPIAVHLQ